MPPEYTIDRTVAIAVAYLTKNAVAISDISALLKSIHSALENLNLPAPAPEVVLAPAVPVKKSVTPDYIVCLEDGKKLKMLKRHLRTSYGLSPDEYRAKWGLPSDYPMVALNYANQRSALAVKIGLGKRAE